MKAIIIVGLGFGDEAKGATVDFLARQFQADTVVRYSGGSQAGHNVELPNGDRHTFSQFGAGTFAGAKTFLGPRMILSPATLPPEAEHLRALGVDQPLGLLTAHPECLLSTFYHMQMNRLRELARGENRHGSCGLGIGETRHYWLRYGQDAITAADLRDPKTLKRKLAILKDRFLQEMQELPHLDEQLSQQLFDLSPHREAEALQHAMDGVSISHRMFDPQMVIFEGAQGVLLDEWKGFHPFTTWSTVTTDHAWELMEEYRFENITTLGLTRAYTTRHGAGPFPTHNAEFSDTILDPGNPDNAWQGAIRSGPLDFPLLQYAVSACPVDGLVVSNLDQVGDPVSICPHYAEENPLPIPRRITEQEQMTQQLQTAQPVITKVSQAELLERLVKLAPIVITADGPTHAHRRWRKDQTVLNPNPSGSTPRGEK